MFDFLIVLAMTKENIQSNDRNRKNFVTKNEKDFSQKISQNFLPKEKFLLKRKKKKILRKFE